MKKIILLTSTTFFVLLAQAQITKGSVLLGGGIYFDSDKSDQQYNNTNRASWGFIPSIGIAVKENLVYGIDLNYNYQQYKYPNYSNKQYYSNYGGGVFLRKYFPLGKNFYLFGEPALGFSYGVSQQVQSSTDYYVTKGWNANLSLYPGISYAISRKFHLETGLANLVYIYYGTSNTKYYYTNATVPPTKGSSFGLNSSLGGTVQLNIGLRFLIAK